MRTSEIGLELIKKYEGLPKPTKDGKYPPYICPAGYPTLGYGSRFHTDGTEVTMADAAITEQEAEELLKATLEYYESEVSKIVEVKINQNQFDALVSFAYNLGPEALRTSTLNRKLNAELYEEAAQQFLVWNKARVNGVLTVLNGLTKRRTEEKEIFERPIAIPAAPKLTIR